MSLRNFRFDPLADTEISSPVNLERAEHNHLFRVLRARAGEIVGLLDGSGWKGTAQVEKGNLLTLLSKEKAELPEKRIHLYIAPPRRQKMDSILKQAAELGVFRIVPVFEGVFRMPHGVVAVGDVPLDAWVFWLVCTALVRQRRVVNLPDAIVFHKTVAGVVPEFDPVAETDVATILRGELMRPADV